ncbi:hypothetical protein BaRGS_00002212 [Batillaria attramentaria]|uniref:Uncharacterized protein n=1 Tax=Batillaria attramentaria TaxID=370345 RepID=A0ABD0M5F1_9CAEN
MLSPSRGYCQVSHVGGIFRQVERNLDCFVSYAYSARSVPRLHPAQAERLQTKDDREAGVHGLLPHLLLERM